MKVIAQSTVPADLQYIHLGYIAAQPTAKNGFLLGGGLLFLALGLALAYSLVLKSGPIFTQYHLVRRKSWVFSVGGGLLILLGCAGILMGILYPDPMAGREGIRRAVCMNYVHQIGLAMVEYADAHEGNYPPSLGTLMQEGYLTTQKVFFCPSSGHRMPPDFPVDLKKADLPVLNQIEKFGSYEMVKGLRHENRSNVIVLYDKPDNHGSAGRNCFFDDGHVRWFEEVDFEKQIKQQKAALREVQQKKGE